MLDLRTKEQWIVSSLVPGQLVCSSVAALDTAYLSKQVEGEASDAWILRGIFSPWSHLAMKWPEKQEEMAMCLAPDLTITPMRKTQTLLASVRVH